MIHASVDIKKLIGNTLDSRDEATNLFNWLQQNYTTAREINFDFTDIDFMSRSFADQFHKEKIVWLNSNNIPVLISNAPIQVIEILQAVSKTQNKVVTNISDLRVYKFSKQEQLVQYLGAL
jgi:hypothetical protein